VIAPHIIRRRGGLKTSSPRYEFAGIRSAFPLRRDCLTTSSWNRTAAP